MKSLTEVLNKEFQNEDFKKEYDSLETEYSLIQTFIDARKQSNVTQKELAVQTGIAQADISKIESGSGNPTIKILKRLADGLDMQLKIELVPKTKVFQ
ncbi:MAG: helix-turn-helix transcriptional regulator [Treponema sp.]